MIYITVFLIAAVVLIWDKTANQDSVSQPQTTQARPTVSPRRVTPAVDPKAPSSAPSAFIDVLPNIPPELMKSEENFLVRKIHNIMQKLLWPPFPLGSALSDYSLPRDLFMATEEFTAAVNPPKPEPKPEVEKKENKLNYTEQAQTLQLSGILIGVHGSYAIINQEVIYQGEHIGPYRLLEVKPDSVILGVEKERIPLYLEE